ncbi:MAG: glycosyltransferase family 39 protein [Patescibacteria group bacterium]|jgi:hypothetical protein
MPDNIGIFVYIVFTYLLGGFVSFCLARTVISKMDFFVRLGVFWIVGNAIAVSVLSFLFITHNLDLISAGSIFSATVILGVINAIILGKYLLAQRKWERANLFWLLAILLFFGSLIASSIYSFLVSWDAVGMWMFKAKILSMSTQVIDSFFQGGKDFLYSNKAYPIGFSLLVSAYYRIVGSVNDQAVQLYLLFYYLNLIFLAFGVIRKSLRHIVHTAISLAVTLLLLITPNFIMYAHNGYVDLPLGATFATLFILVYYLWKEESRENARAYFLLLICSSGLASVLKNEGVSFVFMSLFIATARMVYKRFLTPWTVVQAGLCAIVALFPYVSWAIYKNVYHIAFYLEGHYILNAESFSRLKLVINYYFLEIINTARYNLALIFAVFIFVGEMTFFRIGKLLRSPMLPLLIILTFQLMVYTYVYLVTTMPIVTQIETSLERLVLQLLPSFYLLVVIMFGHLITAAKNSEKHS